MLSDKKKVAIVGVGMVGMSFAYALLNQNICDELVLILSLIHISEPTRP